MTNAYDRGEKHRQDILDKLRAHGPQGVTEIAALTGASVATAHKRVHDMVGLKELTSDGKPRPKYTAAVEKTTPASVFRAKQQAGIAAHNEARSRRGIPPEHSSATKVNGPVTTHVCSEYLPTPEGYGGGQARSSVAQGFSPISALDK